MMLLRKGVSKGFVSCLERTWGAGYTGLDRERRLGSVYLRQPRFAPDDLISFDCSASILCDESLRPSRWTNHLLGIFVPRRGIPSQSLNEQRQGLDGSSHNHAFSISMLKIRT